MIGQRINVADGGRMCQSVTKRISSSGAAGRAYESFAWGQYLIASDKKPRTEGKGRARTV
jgi:hypothetical protein